MDFNVFSQIPYKLRKKFPCVNTLRIFYFL